MGEKINLLPEGPQIKRPSREPIQMLTINLEDEYPLFEQIPKGSTPKEMDWWLEAFPQAWAKTAGMGK